jgi:hypothetical protein
MLCSMVARYAAPLCYNFLYLIRLRTRDGKPSLTVFETKMGTMTGTHNSLDSQNDTILEQVNRHFFLLNEFMNNVLCRSHVLYQL